MGIFRKPPTQRHPWKWGQSNNCLETTKNIQGPTYLTCPILLHISLILQDGCWHQEENGKSQAGEDQEAEFSQIHSSVEAPYRCGRSHLYLSNRKRHHSLREKEETERRAAASRAREPQVPTPSVCSASDPSKGPSAFRLSLPYIPQKAYFNGVQRLSWGEIGSIWLGWQ